MISITLPIKAVNTSNQREHWATRAKRAKAQRDGARMAVRFEGGWGGAPVIGTLGLVVTLTRVAPRAMDDDGAVTSLKAVRDGVADALGVNDNDPRVAWLYAQRRGKVREYAVEVRIEERLSLVERQVLAIAEAAGGIEVES